MYKIEKNSNYLQVKFNQDFDHGTIRKIIHHITRMEEYPHTNDLWIVGKHHANIRLHELETMVNEFQCRCPNHATRTKTAVVAERGQTRSILELWLNATQKRVSFELKLFHTLEEAKLWLGTASPEAI